MSRRVLSAMTVVWIGCTGASTPAPATHATVPPTTAQSAGGDAHPAADVAPATAATPDTAVDPDRVAPLAAPTDIELAAAATFVESLVARTAHPQDPRLLERVDWQYVDAVAATRGEAPAVDLARRRWVARLLSTLRAECGERPLAIRTFAPGAADGQFGPAVAPYLAPPAQARAVEEVNRALVRSLVVTSPCQPTERTNGFDLLLRREADGGLAVRAFRAVALQRGLRL